MRYDSTSNPTSFVGRSGLLFQLRIYRTRNLSGYIPHTFELAMEFKVYADIRGVLRRQYLTVDTGQGHLRDGAIEYTTECRKYSVQVSAIVCITLINKFQRQHQNRSGSTKSRRFQ